MSKSSAERSVLVVGVYLNDRENWAPAIVNDLSNSRSSVVVQRWIALGSGQIPRALASVTVRQVRQPTPKFVLLNVLLSEVDVRAFDHVLVCDDDVRLPAEFVDRYFEIVDRRSFSLAQPARTHDSFIDHPFVEQLSGIESRRTHFVEIGPVFSFDRRSATVLLPFDTDSPMGWGYDLVWPCMMEAAGLTMGIVDMTPVSHSLRKSVTHYVHADESERMRSFLARRRSLPRDDAFFIVESYV